jgi:hypothetical protein
MKEYGAFLKRLERVLSMKRGPVDPPIPSPGGQLDVPPLDPARVKWRQTGQRAFPGWTQPAGKVMPFERAHRLQAWSESMFGVKLGRSKLMELYNVLMTTHPNRLREVMMDRNTPQWMKQAINTLSLKKIRGKREVVFPAHGKRLLGALRGLEAREAKEPKTTMFRPWEAEIDQPAGMKKAAPVAKMDRPFGAFGAGRLEAAKRAVRELKRATDARELEQAVGWSAKRAERDLPELLRRLGMETDELTGKAKWSGFSIQGTPSGPAPAGALGELAKDLPKGMEMARTSMGQPAIGPIQGRFARQELLRAIAILGANPDVNADELVKLLARKHLNKAGLEKALHRFAEAQTRMLKAQYGAEAFTPPVGERTFYDEPRADILKRSKRRVQQMMRQAPEQLVPQIIELERRVGPADLMAYKKTREALRARHDQLQPRDLFPVKKDAALSPKQWRAKLLTWGTGTLEGRLEKLKALDDWKHGRTYWGGATRPEKPAFAGRPVPPPSEGLPLWRGELPPDPDPAVRWDPTKKKFVGAKHIKQDKGAQLLIREMNRVVGGRGRAVPVRRRVPVQEVWKAAQMVPVERQAGQVHVRIPRGPAPLPRTPEPYQMMLQYPQPYGLPDPKVKTPSRPAPGRAQPLPEGITLRGLVHGAKPEVATAQIPHDPVASQAAFDRFRKFMRMHGGVPKAGPKVPHGLLQVFKFLAKMPK